MAARVLQARCESSHPALFCADLQTCFSTFDVGNNGTNNCYGSEVVNATESSLVDYIEAVVASELQYPTYTWLKNAGITPSNTTSYNLTAFESTLTKASGALPYVSSPPWSDGLS